MSIKKLPEYVVNRLKAGEIVERPKSIVKELVENSIDAGADHIQITIKDGGKNYISIQDNWSGIQLSDMELLFERYATSKIETEEDLNSLVSYGFRGEALATIAEVSKVSVFSKTEYAEIATRMVKRWNEIAMTHSPSAFVHGTEVIVEDLFYNVPARLKFLKSAQTEFYYIYNYFLDIALWHFEKSFVFIKNDKVIFDLPKHDSLMERVNVLFKKDWTNDVHPIDFQDEVLSLQGLVSGPNLRFGSGENIKIFVNSRPVNDKIIRRALMDAYARQITPGEYPLAILMLEVKPSFVDVNVHPAKLEVKFLNSQRVYNAVHENVKKVLWNNKIGSVGADYFYSKKEFSTKKEFGNGNMNQKYSSNSASSIPASSDLFAFMWWEKPNTSSVNIGKHSFFEFDREESAGDNKWLGEYQVVGQLWNSYIVLQNTDTLYYIDQHALAERIAYEKMKKMVDPKQEWSDGLKTELLLNPVKFDVVNIPNLEAQIEKINTLGFDVSLLWENKMVVYSVPKIFILYPVVLESLFNHIFYLEEMTFDHILDGVFATKACKTSIKAGHKLSYDQMVNLVKDWFENIDGMFVCQHGRPFFVEIKKKNIDKLFDR